MDMCKHPRLQRRGSRYWFRCFVPADLIDHYSKKEILESLKTSDAREALRLVRARSEQQEQEFDRIRAGRTVIELSDEQVQAIAHEHYVGVLLVDQMDRQRGLSQAEHDAKEVGIDEGEDVFAVALSLGDIEPVSHLVDVALKRHGIALKKDSPSYRALGYALLQSVVRGFFKRG